MDTSLLGTMSGELELSSCFGKCDGFRYVCLKQKGGVYILLTVCVAGEYSVFNVAVHRNILVICLSVQSPWLNHSTARLTAGNYNSMTNVWVAIIKQQRSHARTKVHQFTIQKSTKNRTGV